ncbi:MAG: ATP-binding cassette domain-containing protein [Gammaproteobacteria bacterium]|jgi:ABC-2 type transport system ATP-binding protein|nr:ATP-binding cassette domain-containing protein [Gammaproteobacteria bacterium]MBT4493691.1 ATP-binding cassette domain-containing protein [Gammaproteobacteria bacterium]MBT7371142.1 ATP-binding cassette domain-containing protein [Gammaproteobacteria bacterium]
MNSIELHGVNKYFGDHHAVRDLSFKVPEGTVYGFLGPNGAGKTSTIRMIMSILYPDSGDLTVLGDSMPERVKDRLGYLPEEKGLYKKMKTRDLITYFGTLKGMSRREATKRARLLLDQFGLLDCEDLHCEGLSKGMGQKVQIIATLIHDPDLVILDEPFSGLDPINVELVREIILDLRSKGKTVVFSTHIMEQAEQICDSILLVNEGRKILDGSVTDLKREFEPTLLLEYDGDPDSLHQPGVVRVNNMGRSAELSLASGTDPQRTLKSLMDAVTLHSFTVKEPSLHEIFVRSVGGSTS